MTKTLTSTATVATNQDQQEIADYFRSPRYAFARSTNKSNAHRRYHRPVSRLTWVEPGPSSLIIGVSGLALLTIALAAMASIGSGIAQSVLQGLSGHVSVMLTVQTLFIPPLVGFAFSIVVPMFWYGPIWLRFLMAIASVMPACSLFLMLLQWIEPGAVEEGFGIVFAMVMFTGFVVTAGVAVTVQLWSWWTITHSRIGNDPLPATGIRSIIELTAFAAAGFTVFLSADVSEFVEGMMFFGVVGFLMSLIVIGAMASYFRTGKYFHFASFFVLLFSLGVMAFANVFLAIDEYGEDFWTGHLPSIVISTLYGVGLILLSMWCCLRWLLLTGWWCVNRNHTEQYYLPL